jgi:hypothetical protein
MKIVDGIVHLFASVGVTHVSEFLSVIVLILEGDTVSLAVRIIKRLLVFLVVLLHFVAVSAHF